LQRNLFTSANPIPQQLQERVKQLIARGGLRRGDPLPSYRELCQRFGVSLVTMKRAMDQLAADGIIHIQPQKGVFVERAIAPRARKLTQLGIVYYCSRQLLFSTRYLMEILQGLMLEAEARSADARIFSIKSEGPLAPEELETSGVDGLILVGTANQAYLESVARQPLPAVVLDVFTPGIPLDYVVADNSSAARTVVEKLAASGHRRIAYVDGWSTDTIKDIVIETSDVIERRAGVLDAARVLNLPPPTVFPVCKEEASLTGRRAAEAWLAMPERPTAIVAYDENVARSVIAALAERGIETPRDVSVAAAACAGELSPGVPITAVKMNFIGMGRKAVEVLEARCRQQRLEKERVWRVGGEFIQGASIRKLE